MSEEARRPRILVVDDAVESLRLLVMLLEQLGYETRPVTSGAQALDAAERAIPDLVLLDVTMPDMSGYDVCRALKGRAALRDVPVVFLTGRDDGDDKVKAFEAGGVDYVVKPFEVEEIQARVKTHLALREAQLELAESRERIRALEEFRDELVHMIVHDTRSPLTSIQELSGPLARSRCDLVKIVSEARDAFPRSETNCTVAIEAPGPIEVDCDAGLVRRVVEELVSDAIERSPPQGRIVVLLFWLEGRVRVAIEDEGPAAPIAERSAALGLAFSKLAIQAHGGAIGIEPRGPRGRSVWFELPTSR
jgi:DNA-binding response OmpR family regulator